MKRIERVSYLPRESIVTNQSVLVWKNIDSSIQTVMQPLQIDQVIAGILTRGSPPVMLSYNYILSFV